MMPSLLKMFSFETSLAHLGETQANVINRATPTPSGQDPYSSSSNVISREAIHTAVYCTVCICRE